MNTAKLSTNLNKPDNLQGDLLSGRHPRLNFSFKAIFAALALSINTAEHVLAAGPKSDPLQHLEILADAKQAGFKRALLRKEPVAIEEFKKLGIPIHDDHVDNSAKTEALPLSKAQLDKVSALNPELREQARIVLVPAISDFSAFAKTYKKVAWNDANTELISPVPRAYYELLIGELPGSRVKTFSEQIATLNNDYFISSAPAAFLADAYSRLAEGREGRYYQWLVRVGNDRDHEIVLGNNFQEKLSIGKYPSNRPRGVLGLAISLE